jgi:NAD(P)-dependent dehydrogenase (short-subunit alcohol dehydrogenase family)
MRQAGNGAVVVTASTGIGRATVPTLSQGRYHVFAEVRKASDGAALSELGGGGEARNAKVRQWRGYSGW